MALLGLSALLGGYQAGRQQQVQDQQAAEDRAWLKTQRAYETSQQLSPDEIAQQKQLRTAQTASELAQNNFLMQDSGIPGVKNYQLPQFRETLSTKSAADADAFDRQPVPANWGFPANTTYGHLTQAIQGMSAVADQTAGRPVTWQSEPILDPTTNQYRTRTMSAPANQSPGTGWMIVGDAAPAPGGMPAPGAAAPAAPALPATAPGWHPPMAPPPPVAVAPTAPPNVPSAPALPAPPTAAVSAPLPPLQTPAVPAPDVDTDPGDLPLPAPPVPQAYRTQAEYDKAYAAWSSTYARLAAAKAAANKPVSPAKAVTDSELQRQWKLSPQAWLEQQQENTSPQSRQRFAALIGDAANKYGAIDPKDPQAQAARALWRNVASSALAESGGTFGPVPPPKPMSSYEQAHLAIERATLQEKQHADALIDADKRLALGNAHSLNVSKQQLQAHAAAKKAAGDLYAKYDTQIDALLKDQKSRVVSVNALGKQIYRNALKPDVAAQIAHLRKIAEPYRKAALDLPLEGNVIKHVTPPAHIPPPPVRTPAPVPRVAPPAGKKSGAHQRFSPQQMSDGDVIKSYLPKYRNVNDLITDLKQVKHWDATRIHAARAAAGM